MSYECDNDNHDIGCQCPGRTTSRRVVTDDPTERAIAVFDEFLKQWTPPAMQPHLFDHDMNAAERVRQAIRGI